VSLQCSLQYSDRCMRVIMELLVQKSRLASTSQTCHRHQHRRKIKEQGVKHTCSYALSAVVRRGDAVARATSIAAQGNNINQRNGFEV
jgi:hypothetical protein